MSTAPETHRLDVRKVGKRTPNGESAEAPVIACTKPIPYLPIGWRVAVIDSLADDYAKAGLIMVDDSNEAKHVGELVAAGLAALDVLHSHGIRVGDTIIWGKFAGVWEDWKTVENGKTKITKVLYMSVNDILGSLDLADRVRSGKTVYRKGSAPSGAVQHYLEEK